LGAFKADRCLQVEATLLTEQRGAATEQDRDHVHVYLVDEAKREGLLHDARAVQADDLVASRVLGLLDRAGHASVMMV